MHFTRKEQLSKERLGKTLSNILNQELIKVSFQKNENKITLMQKWEAAAKNMWGANDLQNERGLFIEDYLFVFKFI